jgi:hypothetical protein
MLLKQGKPTGLPMAWNSAMVFSRPRDRVNKAHLRAPEYSTAGTMQCLANQVAKR